MNYTVITFSHEEHRIRQFLELPKHLYSRKERVQNPAEELAILKGTHVLSHYFQVYPFLVIDENETAVSRAVLTIYPEDTNACLGFFESEETEEAVCLLFQEAEQLAKAHGCTQITGPIDASFWIRYRFKTNHFEHSYTGEPYNKDYYLKLWLSAGYQIAEHYCSNHYTSIDPAHQNSQFSARLLAKQAEGYVIKSPSADSFDRTLHEVYGLLIKLYRHFPAYRHITEKEFTSMYGYLKLLIRYPMVKMAYLQKQPVSFFISIPDYGNTVYDARSLFDFLRILRVRLCPRSYVMLYMGVDPAHRGLGKAMAEVIKEELKKTGVPSVGALIRQGNINKDYFQELIDYEFEYVLLDKHLF